MDVVLNNKCYVLQKLSKDDQQLELKNVDSDIHKLRRQHQAVCLRGFPTSQNNHDNSCEILVKNEGPLKKNVEPSNRWH